MDNFQNNLQNNAHNPIRVFIGQIFCGPKDICKYM